MVNIMDMRQAIPIMMVPIIGLLGRFIFEQFPVVGGYSFNSKNAKSLRER